MKYIPSLVDCCLASLEQLNAPVVVQVGSNDGYSGGDPLTRFLESNSRVRALLIEPIDFLYCQLKERHRLRQNIIIKKELVSDHVGEMLFYYFPPNIRELVAGLPDWSLQLGSLNPDHIAGHFGEAYRPYIQKAKLTSKTLPTILSTSGISNIDFLHIDTEGHDWTILRAIDLQNFGTKFILVEHRHLAQEHKTAMILNLSSDYHILDLGFDYLFIAKHWHSQFSDTFRSFTLL